MDLSLLFGFFLLFQFKAQHNLEVSCLSLWYSAFTTHRSVPRAVCNVQQALVLTCNTIITLYILGDHFANLVITFDNLLRFSNSRVFHVIKSRLTNIR